MLERDRGWRHEVKVVIEKLLDVRDRKNASATKVNIPKVQSKKWNKNTVI